jgi:subtilase family serine protease
MRHAYGFDQISSTGAGQTIAIVDAYGSPSVQNDFSVFCNTYGIPGSLHVYYPQGKPKTTNGGWALETSLDVEWAHAIAPGANVVLVVAKTNSFSNLLGAVDYAVSLGAKQVSMSWGSSEFSGETSYDSHFNRTGVTFTASSGDNGAGVEWPAACPLVTGVGGTTLTLDSSGNWMGEAGWSGSGGGVSSYELEPSFQTEWQSMGMRTVPDVSYDADPNTGVPVYDTTSSYGQAGWFQVGGTSAGAPQWAALIALGNASRASSLNGTDTYLYSLGSPSTYGSYFRDITSGSNGYGAVTGYDLVTGIGSPLANSIVPMLPTF